VIDAELDAPHHVTVGFTGVPGSRTFYLQAEDEALRLTLLLEKGQARGIGELLGQLLARIDDAPVTDWDRAAMGLRVPLEPRWRVGELSLGLDRDEDRFLLEVAELVLAGEAEVPAEPREARIWLDRDQARRLAAHAVEVVDQGRPTCELCGRPTELDGSHVCPGTNGHGTLTR
jgi:uncharacterized repeat protein (TIGR03847 family)